MARDTSPMAELERKMLYRIAEKVALPTSLFRPAPRSHFFPHTLIGGEELILLNDLFHDEHRDYQDGTYV